MRLKANCCKKRFFFRFCVSTARCPHQKPARQITMMRVHFKGEFLGPVFTTLKEFKNGGLTLKTSRIFLVHTTLEKVKNATITSHFEFVFDENSGREITILSRHYCFRKLGSISKCFLPTRKWKACVIKFLRFEERSRKAAFSWRISVDSRPDRRNKVAFSKFSEVVGTLQSLVSSPSLCPNLALQRKFQEWFCYIPSASTAQKLCPDHVFVYRFCVACGILRLCINLNTKQPH